VRAAVEAEIKGAPAVRLDGDDHIF
jgi:hypothetical protein